MTIIYEPRGRAREYCEWAANLYRGCGHGCKYCYAPSATRTNRENFYQEPAPRKSVIEKLARQLSRGETFKGPVLLCFTCDPYQPINDTHDLAGQAIRLMKQHGIATEVLTKGGKRAERDLRHLNHDDKVGATLTFTSPEDSLAWEPGAALPHERFALLKEAKKMGIQTWASLEPVIDPEQSLKIILQTHEFVDLFKVGKLNYHPRAREVNWEKFAHSAVDLLESLGKKYYIKKDLQCYLVPA